MKTAARIGLLITVLTLVVVVFLVGRRNPPPSYRDKPFNAWVLQLFSTYPKRDSEALQALLAMGEPAVERLARMVEREDSILTTKLLEQADKVPLIRQIVPSKCWYRYMAAKALGEIGTNAASAIPALSKMALDPDRGLSVAATAALVLVRNESIEQIMAAYVDYSNTNSKKAFGLLLKLGPHAKAAIPVLLNELQSTNDRIRVLAITVLRGAAIESPECLSVFSNLLTDKNNLIRSIAADGLANYGPLAKPEMSSVVKLLDDPDSLCQSSALMFLWHVASPEEFAPFQNKVRSLTNSPNEATRIWAGKLLKEKPSTP